MTRNGNMRLGSRSSKPNTTSKKSKVKKLESTNTSGTRKKRNEQERGLDSNSKDGKKVQNSKNGKSTEEMKTSNSAYALSNKETRSLDDMISPALSELDLSLINSRKGLCELLRERKISVGRALRRVRYEEEIEKLQIELVKLQRWIQDSGHRVAILFEGRDAAGKGGAIRRFVEHLNPRALRVVALPAPTEEERGQWYFQRYSKQLPNRGEIVLFDRSWYNRAVVEPVNGFCTEDDYDRFMRQVPEYEHMLYEDGVSIIKFWFSISKAEQLKRFNERKTNPLKQWKLSPIDARAQELWDLYTSYKEEMFSKTHTSFSPWIIVQANDKKQARLESMRYVLDQFHYADKSEYSGRIYPDPNVISRFHRRLAKLD